MVGEGLVPQKKEDENARLPQLTVDPVTKLIDASGGSQSQKNSKTNRTMKSN